MCEIEPLTRSQTTVFDAYASGYNIAAVGTAGTGKTFTAFYLGMRDVLSGDKDKLVIVRSAVQTRDQGFMPGNLREKEAYYEAPYVEVASSLFGRRDAYAVLKQKGQVEFMTSSFIRGLTIDDAVVLLDECQNFTYHELSSVITRLGENSRMILCGDTKQNDLNKTKFDRTGLQEFLRVIGAMQSFRTIEFTVNDVVRSSLVREFIVAEELMAA